ncbi:hypothetical protein DdX_00648 [Ditylenchus destructor]|uniref:Uncharacterized protein n=1 Tax=Ditylenchus destructor TaxID=166010 RepID=A0AAD4RAJ8_9BILA|nr:hypothetical protein DdX_00648 [Ditylenchus destructor]
MASGNPENPGFGQVTDHATGLGSGRVIRPARQDDWYRSRWQHLRVPGFMASGNPENPGFGQVTDHASGLGSGRVIRQSLRLGELSRLVPVSLATFASTGIYGFRKSGKSWIWPGHRSRVGARIRACDTSIASSRRAESIGTGLAGNICEYRVLWLPEIRKILDDHGRRDGRSGAAIGEAAGQSYGITT